MTRHIGRTAAATAALVAVALVAAACGHASGRSVTTSTSTRRATTTTAAPRPSTTRRRAPHPTSSTATATLPPTTVPPTVAAPAPTTPPASAPLAAGATTTIVVTNGGRTLPTTLTIPPGARPWPTVVFAAGYDIEPAAYEQLTHSWAAAGYLVAAPASPGMAPSQGPVTEAQLPNVPGDLSAVATRVVADGLADPGRLAAVGHSDGASAVGALALTADHADARFRAFVVLAGDITTLPDAYGPRNGAPLLAATGDADEFDNAVLTPQLYRTAAAPKALVVAHGGSHLGSFLGDTPQATAMRAAIVDFLGASLGHAPWSPLAGLNGQAGLTVTSSGLPG